MARRQAETYCAESNSGSVDGFAAWPPTPAGKEVTDASCADGYEGAPTRVCEYNGVWGEVKNPCTGTTYSADN